jgi:phenylpyruvate tautomerase PptA (4-oxalocrotonate tautomerase family)
MIISVQIADTRPKADKRKLLAAIVRLLHENVGINRDDVFVSLIPIPPENFSCGRGFSPFDKGD